MTGQPEPLLSIITVTRNNLKGLLKTAHSVNEQEQRTDIQWVIIDGKSSDDTSKEIQKHLRPTDYFVSEKDKGLYDAMNKGLKVAKGRFVWFLNAGDTVFAYNSALLLFPHLDKYEVLYGETMLTDIEGKKLGIRSEKTTRKLPINLTFESLLKGMVVNHQSIIVSKEICPEFDLKWNIAADYEWLCKLLKNNPKTYNTKLIHSCFELGGLSSQKRKSSWKERFYIMLKYFGLKKTLKAHSKIIGRAIQRNFDTRS